MKKTLKSILAIALALIMSFGSLTVFAAEGDKIGWDFGWWVDEYLWAGEATVGKNTVSCNEDAYQTYFDFNAENSGYYSIIYDTNIIDWAGFPVKLKGQKASGESFVTYIADDDGFITVIVKLEIGATVLGVDYDNLETPSAEITIDYLGDAVTDIVIDEKCTADLVDNNDIYCEYSEGAMLADYKVVFSSGKSIEFEKSAVNFECADYTEGENKIIVVFEDFKKEVTVTVSSVESIVKSAELSNYQNYTNIKYDYNENSDMNWIYDESVKITFTNGETFVAPINSSEGIVIFPNGKEYYVSVGYEHNEDGALVLSVYVAGIKFAEYACTENEAGIFENIDSLKNENYYDFSEFLNELTWYLDRPFEEESDSEFFKALGEGFFDSFVSFSYMISRIFENFMAFFKYYLIIA